MVVGPPKQPDAATRPKNRRNRRPKRRELFCPAHPEQRIEGNGQKYFLHLLSPEQLQQRGISAKRAQLIINAYPVLVLSNEWLEELYCPKCGSCTVPCDQERQHHPYRALGTRELWERSDVDPTAANPTVSDTPAGTPGAMRSKGWTASAALTDLTRIKRQNDAIVQLMRFAAVTALSWTQSGIAAAQST